MIVMHYCNEYSVDWRQMNYELFPKQNTFNKSFGIVFIIIFFFWLKFTIT